MISSGKPLGKSIPTPPNGLSPPWSRWPPWSYFWSPNAAAVLPGIVILGPRDQDSTKTITLKVSRFLPRFFSGETHKTRFWNERVNCCSKRRSSTSSSSTSGCFSSFRTFRHTSALTFTASWSSKSLRSKPISRCWMLRLSLRFGKKHFNNSLKHCRTILVRGVLIWLLWYIMVYMV